MLPQLIDIDNTAGKVWADTAYRSVVALAVVAAIPWLSIGFL